MQWGRVLENGKTPQISMDVSSGGST